jgi:16S rRNA (guanine527-N7)-methyltransferase
LVLPESQLEGALAEGRRRGLIGRGELRKHVEHGRGFLRALSWSEAGQLEGREINGARVLDLGSGAGLPGLVLAGVRGDFEVVLVDANLRSASFLDEAIAALGLGERVAVVRGRAEELGRDPALRGSFDLVVARGFGKPAVTAECGAPFLRVGGRMVVSEPPYGAGETRSRWPAKGLEALGLQSLGVYREDFSYQVLTQQHPCPEAYPRRTGVPAKRPLF